MASCRVDQLSFQVVGSQQSVRRGGGTWRAFLHDRCRGQHGKPNFSALAREYAAQGCKEDPELRRLGSIASVARKAMAKQYGHTSFGPSARVIQRLKAKRLRDSVWQRQRDVYSQ
eukprot:784829-Amphidinium_carterae.4